MDGDLEKAPSKLMVEEDPRCGGETIHPQKIPSEDRRLLRNPFTNFITNPTPRKGRMGRLRKELVITVRSLYPFSFPIPIDRRARRVNISEQRPSS